jgi:aryl-alcohol dehydrogenase-like predicted oxidoreductase
VAGGNFVAIANKYHEGQSEEILGSFLGPDATASWWAPSTPWATFHGWSPLVALQVEYSLLERTAERELLPVAEAFGLAVTAWAPMGAGVLTGKYTRGASTTPADSRRAAANQPRLGERNLAITREVDRVADQLGASSAQVAVAWVRQPSRRIIPVVGIRAVEQLQDVLGAVEVELPAQ